jgi:hypothetical protein
MTESLLLAAAGAACGLVLGLIGIHALLSVNTAGLPRVGIGGELVRMDWRVVSANPAFQPGIPKPLFKTKARQARPDSNALGRQCRRQEVSAAHPAGFSAILPIGRDLSRRLTFLAQAWRWA